MKKRLVQWIVWGWIFYMSGIFPVLQHIHDHSPVGSSEISGFDENCVHVEHHSSQALNSHLLQDFSFNFALNSDVIFSYEEFDSRVSQIPIHSQLSDHSYNYFCPRAPPIS